MLNKSLLKNEIEKAVATALQDAFAAVLDISRNQESDNFNNGDVAKKFANEAKKCAGDIADAIEKFIKSATLILPSGTTLYPSPALVSPAGPCSGAIILTAPVKVEKTLQ